MLGSLELIYPMFAMVLLTFGVVVALFISRVRSVREGKISPFFYKTYQGDVEPEISLKLSQHFVNLFETPVLFYVACLVAMVLNSNTTMFVVLAWLFVILRAIHFFVHVGKNKLKKRIGVYFASWLVLILMWVQLLLYI